MNVQIAGVAAESVTDGPGLRTTIFFQGCKHHCAGCHNPQTWDFEGGTRYDLEAFISKLPDSPLVKGVTLTGGDPFYQPLAVAAVARGYKQRGKDVWAYTGFTWEELLEVKDAGQLELLRTCDVLVDGPFIQSQLSLDLPFRGSSNQRLISVRESLESGKVFEFALNR
jgi:anaerobic ribonucleoside-triphosphate reductase activating protein